MENYLPKRIFIVQNTVTENEINIKNNIHELNILEYLFS